MEVMLALLHVELSTGRAGPTNATGPVGRVRVVKSKSRGRPDATASGLGAGGRQFMLVCRTASGSGLKTSWPGRVVIFSSQNKIANVQN